MHGGTGRRGTRLALLGLCSLLFALAAAGPAAAQLPTVDPTVPAARDTEPVVVTGRDFPGWAARSNFTFRMPLLDLTECQSFDAKCEHNHYAEPNFDSQQFAPQEGPATDKLLGYRWNAKGRKFTQIPFQVDEQFVRYLANPASGFSFYSGEDQHTTYAFDREGFRYTRDGPADNPCQAQPDSPTAQDPVKGLDDDDELAFMARGARGREAAQERGGVSPGQGRGLIRPRGGALRVRDEGGPQGAEVRVHGE
jgi:hypothetical protein